MLYQKISENLFVSDRFESMNADKNYLGVDYVTNA